MRKPKTFNNPERFVEGWYWVMPSQNLRIGEVKPVTILGRNLVIYRGKDKRVVICDAYCPHMGAHLAEGQVEGNEIRCFFHHWKFDEQGVCTDIPCLTESIPVKLKTWPTAEKYKMIWVWTGENPQQPIPFVPELEFEEYESLIGPRIITNCHPNVVMINPIDAQHFSTVHQLPGDFFFEKVEIYQNALMFNNYTRGNEETFFGKLIHLFNNNNIYQICYWNGSTFTLTFGSDFIHLHIMVTLHLLKAGKCETQLIFITKKRRGIVGKVLNRWVLWLTSLFAGYFVKGDAKVLQTIRFDFKTPIKADQAIIQFINYIEKQKPLMWETWQLARSREVEPKENNKWREDLTND
ncbi:aromatic ring-hydroxylating dioxygenase subunit alpha [Nostoc sp. FACHB-152]|uniref:aromatic ring-hydroxylating dioxygenase subunit alpha n=1 Tax=unclassified Nostoc TaxID=2593658 RepID=UPI0016869971|nr:MULTISPECIES: aromatic ring-hydroxylating dioxygenase subunit alpha [unclassified Nostoc]MBD2448371.1 aromatic ring-hydroxylating dioxygenase subunit alpha [Nostoc sp. FACHB-152]MBD2469730.1 aromatic ring-hydroxylating dioxygenase subunit alpha [Nostoc sp. FACHB-145]